MIDFIKVNRTFWTQNRQVFRVVKMKAGLMIGIERHAKKRIYIDVLTQTCVRILLNDGTEYGPMPQYDFHSWTDQTNGPPVSHKQALKLLEEL